MTVCKVLGLAKAYGAEDIFSDVRFELRKGEIVGLIGGNGTGKTTLIRCMLGLEAPDAGQVVMAENATVGYVEQQAVRASHSLWDELLTAFDDVLADKEKLSCLEIAIAQEKDEASLDKLMRDYAKVTARFEHQGGYGYEAAIRRVAAGLGFSEEDFSQTVDTFSGGQKTRIGLARALVRQPDMLFLDEPTNHLDIVMTEWLEEFLLGYTGGALIISHDRYFLDRVAGRVFEMSGGKITEYKGNYSSYLRQKIERQSAHEVAYDKQQEYITKTEEYIRRYKAGIKSKQARGRQSQLDRLERLSAPEKEEALTLLFPDITDTAQRVAELLKVSMSYGDKSIFDHLSLLIRRKEKTALVGPNGAGKTTLLKVLLGDIMPTAGSIKLGSRVKIGYFAQEHEGLRGEGSLLTELMDEYAFSEGRARNYLGAFLFHGDEVFKAVADLSGGERARLALLKLMLAGANFLVLDEPTNHLDIPSKEAVEEAIMNFPGTLFVVSHDRYLLDKVAGRIVELDNGKLTDYIGNYSEYRQKKAALALIMAQSESKVADNSGRKESVQEVVPFGVIASKKNRRSPQDIARLTAKVELEIRELEALKGLMEKKLADPASHLDPTVSQVLADEYVAMQEAIDEKYRIWEELQE